MYARMHTLLFHWLAAVASQQCQARSMEVPAVAYLAVSYTCGTQKLADMMVHQMQHGSNLHLACEATN
jgi:hypothetical protein